MGGEQRGQQFFGLLEIGLQAQRFTIVHGGFFELAQLGICLAKPKRWVNLMAWVGRRRRAEDCAPYQRAGQGRRLEIHVNRH